ncbi:radical SAM protein [bacterium]|nr:radical SAM protein [candidate division CSSED10-310 bacterium]
MFPFTRQEKVARLAEYITKGSARPYTAELHLAHRCNLRCRFCAMQDNRYQPKRPLPPDGWRRLVERLAEMGVKEWRLGGGLGEVLCAPELFLDLAAVIKQNGGHGWLTTNGTLFSERVTKRLIELNWDRIEFSLDGATAATHDMLRGVPGAYDALIRAVRAFSEARHAQGTATELILHTVITSANQPELPGLVTLAAGLGVDGIFFEPVAPVSDNARELVIDPAAPAFRAAHAEAMQRAESQGTATNLAALITAEPGTTGAADVGAGCPAALQMSFGRTIFPGGDCSPAMVALWRRLPLVTRRWIVLGARCFEPFYGLAVRVDGTVQPCCSAALHAAAPADILHFWRGSMMKKLRRKLLRDFDERICARCMPSIIEKTNGLRADLDRFLENQPPW